MTEGWIKLYRQIEDNLYWLAEPFTRAQAWIDLLLLANHKPGFIRVRGVLVKVERGQVGWSERELAKRWRWSRGKVRRFFSELASNSVQQIEPQKNNVTTLITIINYDHYQSDDTTSGTANGPQTDRKRYQNKNVKNEKKNNKTFPDDSPAYQIAFFLLTQILNRKPDFKKPNLQSWAKDVDLMIRVDKRDPEQIKAVIKWCQEDCIPRGGGFCWANNILSAKKLREKYDKLVLEMKNRRQSHGVRQDNFADRQYEGSDLSSISWNKKSNM